MPQESELVMCTVTNIQHHSVFASLDEYPGKQGMIHISEVSPGRIRNIRDYVKEGKKVVCKVLRIDLVKGHIDLSLRRVTDSQRRAKTNELKQEQIAEKIIEIAAKEVKKDFKKFYEEISSFILKEYPNVYSCFKDVSKGEITFEKLGIDKKTAEVLSNLISQRIKKEEVEIEGEFKLTSYEGNGVEIIRKSLEPCEKNENCAVNYLGGGRYKLVVKAENYKDAEKILDDVRDKTLAYIEEHNGEGEFVRED